VLKRAIYSIGDKKRYITMLFIVMAPFVYFSGRNFQTISTSVDNARKFLRIHTQIQAELHITTTLSLAYFPLLTNSTFPLIHWFESLFATYNYYFFENLHVRYKLCKQGYGKILYNLIMF